MTVFVDASALVAIIADEPDARDLESRLAEEHPRLTSGVAVWETARAVAKASKGDIDTAFDEVERLCGMLHLTVVPIAALEAREALRAQARYGKGTHHPARLNMGDCFAYACARTNGAKLLYKGNDFIHTDLR